MKTLLTGADGFIGSHLAETLLSAGHNVRAFCQYNSFGHRGWLDTLPKDVIDSLDIYMGDVRDPSCVNEAMSGCDQVFHLAALITIPYSYTAPSSYIHTNVLGTLNMLQAARQHGISSFVHTSTSETYGSAQFVPITEDHQLVGQSPYSASKIAADYLALSFYHSFGLPVKILKPFNTYGPRQSTRAVIPTIITQIASGQCDIKLGSLSPTRDFNYVKDTCSAFLSISRSAKAVGQVLNSASNFEISIGHTASLIAKIMNKDITISCDSHRVRPDGSEVVRLYGDNTKLRTLTMWAPEYSGLQGFVRGLTETIHWFTESKNLQKYRPQDYSF